MKILITFLIALLSSPAYAGTCGLNRKDYPGMWVSNWAAIKGEKDKLKILPNLSSTFERKFGKTEKQNFRSKKADVYEDLLVFKYFSSGGDLRYKLVLSGWKVDKNKMLYGTLYMYYKGEQFNGLPVTFSSK